MIKMGTDGSGVATRISGCPNCDNESSDCLRYVLSHWALDVTGDDRALIRIKYCPFCGVELPYLNGWEIVKK